jgi:hypothetical protein
MVDRLHVVFDCHFWASVPYGTDLHSTHGTFMDRFPTRNGELKYQRDSKGYG